MAKTNLDDDLLPEDITSAVTDEEEENNPHYEGDNSNDSVTTPSP